MSRPPLRPPELLRGPFRGTDAIRSGLITKAQLNGSVWRSLFRDVYVCADSPNSYATRIAGALLVVPASVTIAGTSAARVWGVRYGAECAPIEVHSPTPYGPVRGLTVHTGPIPPTDVTRFRGVPVTTPTRTAWDIARRVPLLAAVPWIDALSHQRAISRADLLAYAAARHGDRGGRIAAATLRRCDPRAESPMESVLRVHLHVGGVPVVPQYWIMLGDEFVARADLALPELRLAIEYDGQWHSDPHQLGRDRARLREINRAGWHVYPVTKEDMLNPDRVVRDIKSVIAKRYRSRG